MCACCCSCCCCCFFILFFAWQLLDEAGCSIDACDADGCTPLAWAARHGQTDCILLLLSRGAAVDPIEKLGWTPLMEAAFGNHPDTVRALLDARANPRLENRQLESALSNAREVHSEACVALLCAALSGAEVLLDACQSGDARRVRETLASGVALADVDDFLARRQSHHRERSTALHWASANGHVACIAELLQHGACVDAADAASGWTPLMAAVANHQIKAVAALVAARADPLRQSAAGSSPMSAACRAGNPCKALLEAAAAEEAARAPAAAAEAAPSSAQPSEVAVELHVEGRSASGGPRTLRGAVAAVRFLRGRLSRRRRLSVVDKK